MSFQAFQSLHKYFRLFDDLNEVYNDLITKSINIKAKNIDEGTLILSLFVTINNINHEIDITLKKKELDKYKDIDIIKSNYIEMKKELDKFKADLPPQNPNSPPQLIQGPPLFQQNDQFIQPQNPFGPQTPFFGNK